MKKKAIALTAVACSVAMLLGACGTSNNSSKSANSINSSAIISAWDSEPQNPLVPGNTNETAGGVVVNLIFSQLVAFQADGKAVNEVAEKITPNSDSSKFTIKLKKGWKFTDGTPVTSSSFTKAWSYTANAKNAQKNASFFSTIKGYEALQGKNLKGDEQLSGLKVIDDQNFEVTLNHPDSSFLIKMGYSGYAPLPEAFFKDPKKFGENPIGNGPYKFVKWDHNKTIDLVKNPDYKGVFKVNNGGVSFRIYTSPSAAYADIESGALDIMSTVPSEHIRDFRNDKNIRYYLKPGSVIQTIEMRTDVPHWQTNTEEGVLRRQAISRAIDRKLIIKKVLNGLNKPAVEFTSPLTPGYSDSLKGKENLEFDAAKAKELWAKAEAISKLDTPVTFAYNADGGSKAVMEAIMNSVKNTLGIKVGGAPYPTFKEFRNAIDKGEVKGFFRGGWQPDYPSAEDYLFQLYASGAADDNGSNDSGYSNPAFDKLLDDAYRATSQDAANKLYQKSQEYLLHDLPAIPLYYGNNIAVTTLKIHNLKIGWDTVPLYYALTKDA